MFNALLHSVTRIYFKSDQNPVNLNGQEHLCSNMYTLHSSLPTLNRHNLARIHFDTQKTRIILDELPTSHQLMRHKARKPETQRVRLRRRSLKISPRRIRHKRLGNAALRAARMAAAVRIGALLEQRKRDRMLERPLQQRIVLAGQHLNVHGHVRALAGPVAVEEQRRLQLVPVLARVERRRHQLQSLLAARLRHLGRPLAHLPQQRARIVGAQLRHGALQLRDLRTLPAAQRHHQRQMLRRILLQMRLECGASAAEPTARLLERARVHRGRNDGGGRLLCGSRCRHGGRTLRLVRGQRVGAEFAGAMRTAQQTLRAIGAHVRDETAAPDAQAALGLAVDRLGRTGAGVLFERLAAEVAATEFAARAALRARELNVIGHHDARDLGTAAIRTGGGVVLASVEVCLFLRVRIRCGCVSSRFAVGM